MPRPLGRAAGALLLLLCCFVFTPAAHAAEASALASSTSLTGRVASTGWMTGSSRVRILTDAADARLRTQRAFRLLADDDAEDEPADDEPADDGSTEEEAEEEEEPSIPWEREVVDPDELTRTGESKVRSGSALLVAGTVVLGTGLIATLIISEFPPDLGENATSEQIEMQASQTRLLTLVVPLIGLVVGATLAVIGAVLIGRGGHDLRKAAWANRILTRLNPLQQRRRARWGMRFAL